MSGPGNPPAGPTLRIVRATGLGRFTGAGSAGPSPPFTGVGGPFAARLPIRAGDLIGIDLPCQGIANSPVVYFLGSGENYSWEPALLDGETPGRAGSKSSQSILVNADVEADADRDGFGDETQDACLNLPGSISGCPKSDVAVTETATHANESDLVTYHVVETNNGPDQAPIAIITASLPGPAGLVSRPGGTCGVSAALRCGTVPLASGQSSTFNVTVRLPAGRYTDSAAITSADLAQAATKAPGAGDPNSANDSGGVTVIVVAPSASSVRAIPSRFRLGSLLPRLSRRPPLGTTVSFRLSEPSRATLTFSQPKTGRKIGRRCKPLTRANRRKPKCTIPNVRGTLSFNGHAGTNHVRFQGRLSRTRRLKPVRYTLTVTATDSAGNRSRPKSTRFTIVR
jgi:hypothetical protein